MHTRHLYEKFLQVVPVGVGLLSFCEFFLNQGQFLGRLLITSIWGSDVRPYVRTYVRLSAKSFSDSDEIGM